MRAAGGGDGVAELAQHVLEQHADHQLVLDDENPQAAGGASGFILRPQMENGVPNLQTEPVDA